jgi:hypothetical protein
MTHGEKILVIRLYRELHGGGIIFNGCIYHKPCLTDIENKGYIAKKRLNDYSHDQES